MTKAESRDPHLPLAGFRVVDFSRQIAGPYAAMLLGDLGADVIKVEQPRTGDDSRRLAPRLGDMSSVFIGSNRNKRSIELNLKSDAGRAVATELVDGADILVENFMSGAMDRLGLGYEEVSARNPGLIYCSVTAFGHTGGFANRPGFDPVTQADCGLFSLNGEPDGPPIRVAAPIVDVASGLTAFGAIQAALIDRLRGGQGRRVEVALFDVGVALSAYFPTSYMLTGRDPVRSGNQSQVGSPSGLFSASDGDFFMSCSTDRMFVVLAEQILAIPDLATRQEFHTNSERLAHNPTLNAVLEPIFRTRPRAEWVDRMLAAGIPAGAVRTVGQAVESAEAKDRGLFTRLDHPDLGAIPNIAPPFRLGGAQAASPSLPPHLGQHTDEVLAEVLGYSRERIAELHAGGAFA